MDLYLLNSFLGSIGMIISFVFISKLLAMPKGKNDKDKQIVISNMIKEAAFVYLRKQYKVIWIVALCMSVLLFKIFGLISMLFFFLGVFSSTLSGFIAMFIAVNGNVRTVEGAQRSGLAGAFKSAIYAGAGASFFLNSMGILVVLPVFFVIDISSSLICLIMGVSLVSIFARLGGGIFTKGADVGADMVGKTQMGLPEDDARNPATIADNVGDNVGDTAGMAADLFETYVVSTASCIMIALEKTLHHGLYLPLSLCSVGLLSSMIPILFMKFKNVWGELGGYFHASVGLFIVGSFAILQFNLGIQTFQEFCCIMIGAFCVVGILKITEYYTSCDFKPVKNVAKASESGDGSNVIFGLAYGFESVLMPLILILISVLLCYRLCDVWGIALGVMGITALSPSILLLDIFGPVSDNAGGIAEMSKLNKDVRKITDELDAVGNTTKAITKGYAIGSAIFASLIMFYFFKFDLLKFRKIILNVDLFDPFVIIGLFIGCLLPYIFSGLSMKSVSRAASAVVEEVRSQIKKFPEILEGKRDPDYKKTVDFLTEFAIKEMILPGLIPIIALVIVFILGMYFGPVIMFLLVGSILVGVTLSGSLMSIFMTIAGGLWDNTKKYIENEEKGTPKHKAAVTGDTIGDPFKDTVGPSLNSFIKFTNVLAILLIHI
jgi:K(+)-stimulated pyrophosphate-energized sodium pump